MSTPFGNDPAKIERYRKFWRRDTVERPLVGFSLVGWFPLAEFAVTHGWESGKLLSPDMVRPAEFLDDHVRMLREGEVIEDDLIRGTGPTQVAIPFMPGILGCALRILPDNVLGEDQHRDWDSALSVRLDTDNRWFRVYLEFAEALVARAAGQFPVSHGAEIGPTDMHASLRGHGQSVVDAIDEPAKTGELLMQMGHIFRGVTEEVWKRIPTFHGGYFDGQYSLWAPGPIARLQEDASALYSPTLYRDLVQPVDRMLARSFACAFMHLHSTSMFLLDAFLEIEELRCLEINNDVSGPPIAQMVPYFRRVQEADRSLVIRGSFEPDELKLLLGNLAPDGLMLLIMVRDHEEISTLRPVVGMG
jgi:hypothetical protein